MYVFLITKFLTDFPLEFSSFLGQGKTKEFSSYQRQHEEATSEVILVVVFWSSSLIIRQMQIITPMRYYLT
jgi:hypothetical protein